MRLFSRFPAALGQTLLMLFLLANTGCNDQTFSQRMRGREWKEVVAALGSPVDTSTFRLSPNLNEFQGGVLAHATPTEVAAAVPVLQAKWTRLRGNRYVWFIKRQHHWVAVDALYWPPGRNY